MKSRPSNKPIHTIVHVRQKGTIPVRELLYIALLSISLSFAQSKQFHISGTVVSGENLPLESATVYLENPNDNTLATYTVSDVKGKFELKGKSSSKRLDLFVSFVGYTTYQSTVVLDKRIIPLDTIQLEIDATSLQAVHLQSRAPVLVKKDTLEFNVKSFRTRKDANVEELLKKLPFVEVGKDGSITVNGKEVNKVLVNGQPFFGDNVTAATRNLTKDIIDKVQVTDTRSTSESFRGEEGDRSKKTINLTISKDNNTGIFGRVSVAGGTQGRYELSGVLNRFDGDRRVNVIANKNNTTPDKSNQTANATSGFLGNQTSQPPALGLTTSSNIGAVYVDRFAKESDFSTNVTHNMNRTENENRSQQEIVLAGSRYFSSSISRSVSDNRSYNSNMKVALHVDPSLLINISPSYTQLSGQTASLHGGMSLNQDKQLTNQSNTSSFSQQITSLFSNLFDLNKRFEGGSTLLLSIYNEINASGLERSIKSKSQIFDYDTVNETQLLREEINRDQIFEGTVKTNSLTTNISYKMPLTHKKLFLSLGYKYHRVQVHDRHDTYNFNLDQEAYTDFNRELSTKFESVRSESTPSVVVSYNYKKVKTSLALQAVLTTLENRDELRPELSANRNFQNKTIRYNFRYAFSKKLSFLTGYDFHSAAPQLSQIVPFENITDPLNTIVGNPRLKSVGNHNYYCRLQNYNMSSGLGFFIMGGLQIRENQIVAKTIVDEQTLVRQTSFVNVNGTFSYNFDMAVMKKIELDSANTLDINFRLTTSGVRQVNYTNGIQYESMNKRVSPKLQINFNFHDIVEIAPSYAVTHAKTGFDITAFNDREFLTHGAAMRISTFIPKNLEWNNEIAYNYNRDVAPGFQKSSWLWNSSLTYVTLQDRGFFSLKIFDLLDQNTNARRIATDNYVQDVQSTVMKQYFLIGFSWKFSSLAARKV